jgi:Ulp1 protease family, C-terminal catalytic domain
MSDRISDNLRPPELPGQLMGTVVDGDDLYSIAIYCRGVRISLFDLKCLEIVYGDGEVAAIQRMKDYNDIFKPTMLPDTIIDAWFYSIQMDYPFLTVEPCGQVTNWILNGVPETARRIGQIKFGTQAILLPINAHGNHWSLMIYYVEKNSFLHLDSHYCASASVPSYEKLKAGVSAEFGLPCLQSVVKAVEVSKQTAGTDFDSGVYMIHYAQCCAQGLPFTTPCDTVKIRRDVFEKIMENSI